MIITKLQGGLGNQMFQYAAGKALAVRNRATLFLDERFLFATDDKLYTRRHFELDQWHVSYKTASVDQLKRFTRKGIVQRLTGHNAKKCVTVSESSITAERFHRLKGNLYLDGYWQSEAYFLSVRELLLQDFTPRDGALTHGADLTGETVGVHVRRGDYVSLPSAAAFHGTLGMDYYKKAFALVKEKINDARFFVFSDDPDWCREAFSDLPVAGFMDGRGQPSARDMFLMSKCAHNIIANSSYSWWSAWLNTNPSKIVVAPQNWFADKSVPSGHIICKGWLTV